MTNITGVQAYMREQKIDGWLLYDFRGSNAVFTQLLPPPRTTTRRAALFIPASGEPVLLGHSIDGPAFASVSVRREQYLTWRQWREWLERTVAGRARIAMEYAPGGGLPAVSMADAGTVELVRSLGAEVVSSANLIQVSVARWPAAAVEQHAVASRKVAAIKDEAFALIRTHIAAGQAVSEYEVQQHILSRFAAEQLETAEAPIVAANAHSGDPHFETSAHSSVALERGDWVLIDLWARVPGDENVYSDITWVGFAGNQVPPKHREVFETVRAARDASVSRATAAWKSGERVQGWQLDEAAREVIVAAGYEPFIKHRTGHSLSPGPKVHGLGFNLDNLETHDTREMLPELGFTVEPGVYLPEFGVRLEIDLFVDPQRGPVITSPVQQEVVLLA